MLRDALAGADFQLTEAVDQGLEPLTAVHTPQYLEFLRHAWERRAEAEGRRTNCPLCDNRVAPRDLRAGDASAVSQSA